MWFDASASLSIDSAHCDGVLLAPTSLSMNSAHHEREMSKVVESRGRPSEPSEHAHEVIHRLKMIDMVGSRVAGKPEDPEMSSPRGAELLHAERPPEEHRRALQTELLEEIIRRFCRADKRSRKDLRVRDEELLAGRD
jgi:hypothetical protein